MKHEALASEIEKKVTDLKQAIADYCCEPECCEEPKPSYAYVDNRIQYLQDQLSSLYESLWRHTQNGHLPSIDGAERMSKALKVLGLDGDYKVEKKVIYANDGKPTDITFKFKL